MKKLIIVLLFAVLAGEIHAQGVQVGIKAGVNFANTNFSASGVSISPDGVTSFHGGVYAKIMFNDMFGIQPEVLYSKQGFSLGGFEDKFTYLQIPILLRFNIIPEFNIHGGPQYAILMSADETYNGVTSSIKDQLQSGDFGLAIGAGFDLPMGLNGGIRYVAGLTNIDNSGSSSSGATAKNTVFQIYLGFKLFGN